MRPAGFAGGRLGASFWRGFGARRANILTAMFVRIWRRRKNFEGSSFYPVPHHVSTRGSKVQLYNWTEVVPDFCSPQRRPDSGGVNAERGEKRVLAVLAVAGILPDSATLWLELKNFCPRGAEILGEQTEAAGALAAASHIGRP